MTCWADHQSQHSFIIYYWARCTNMPTWRVLLQTSSFNWTWLFSSSAFYNSQLKVLGICSLPMVCMSFSTKRSSCSASKSDLTRAVFSCFLFRQSDASHFIKKAQSCFRRSPSPDGETKKLQQYHVIKQRGRWKSSKRLTLHKGLPQRPTTA